MYAIFAMRKMLLTTRINQIQHKLMQLSQKLNDIALFGANIQDGVITPDEFMNSPASIFGAQVQFGQQAIQTAIPQANMQMQLYLQNQAYQQQMGLNTQMRPDDNLMYREFLRQAMESAARSMTKRIAAEENKIAMERTRLETQLKAAQSELENCERAEDEGIKRSAPKYTA